MAETDDDEVRGLLTTNVGQRVAGGLLLANAILVFAERLFVPTPVGGLPNGTPDEMLGGSIVGGIFDIVIGGALLGGNSQVVGLAIGRVILGLVVFGGIRVAQGDLFLAGVQVAVSASFLLVLVGRAGKLRIAAAGLLFGLYVALEAFGLYVIQTGRNPLGGVIAAARGDVEGPAGEVVGLSSAYRLRAPSAAWLLRKPEAAKKDNPLADRWLMRPELDVHAIVIAEDVPGSAVPVDALVQVVIDNARGAAQRFDVLSTEPSERYPEDGRRVRAKARLNGLELDFLYGVFTSYGHGYQVVAFAPSQTFAEVEPELRAIVDSFTLPDGPPTLLEVPARAPAGRVVGVAAPYAFTAPSDRWFLRSAEAAHKDNPLVDQAILRPDRDATVFVIAEQLPGPTDIETFAAAVEAMIKDRPGVDVSPREPWRGAAGAEGRLIHARALTQGLAIDFDYAVFVAGDRGFQVVGLSRAEFYPLVKDELRATLASFEPPPAQ